MPHTGTDVFLLVPAAAASLIAGSVLVRRKHSRNA
ncbi:LPXTG cell wall anchor domain-containing protein [Catenulispora subtropica]